jgi:hypothetical protein
LLGKYFQDKINTIASLNQLRDSMKLLKNSYSSEAFAQIDLRKSGAIYSSK